MKRKVFKVLLLSAMVWSLITLVACQNSEEADASSVQGTSIGATSNETEKAVSSGTIENTAYSLQDELIFAIDLDPYQIMTKYGEKEIAVVANDNTFYYELASGVSIDAYQEVSYDRDGAFDSNLENFFVRKEKLPRGTIVTIEEKLENQENFQLNGMVFYQENYNYFYKISIAKENSSAQTQQPNGKDCFVFGADLTAFSEDCGKEESIFISKLYQCNGKPNEFYQVGYGLRRDHPRPIYFSEEVQDSLYKNHVALEDVRLADYSIYSSHPDDMIALYYNLTDKEDTQAQTPVFITTDLLAHTQHIFFDRTLQAIEEKVFAPRLYDLVNQYINSLCTFVATDYDEFSSQLASKAIDYLTVAQYFLVQAIQDESMAQNMSLEYLSENCRSDIESILQAVNENLSVGLKSTATLVEYREDFSQYKPRGHYTVSETLKNYFIAQMWLGRVNFLFNDEGADEMVRIALLLADLTAKDENLYTAWKKVFDPITSLIGDSDDLSFYEILPLWQAQKVTNFNEWIRDKFNVLDFIALCQNQLEPPAIAGNSVFYSAQTDGEKPKLGFKFLSNRFTYDSAIHTAVSSPRLFGRQMVSGLDIMSAFGSNYAKKLLATEENTFPDLATKLKKYSDFFNSRSENFWKKNYYNSILNQIKTQAEFEKSQDFYFTTSDTWDEKALTSALGTWAELRHDTILYVKQAYAEMGGGDYIEPTYRKDKLNQLTSYIEPNNAFFEASLASLQVLTSIDEKYQIFDDAQKQKLNALNEIYKTSLDLVKKEISGLQLNESEANWIKTIPSKLTYIIFPTKDTYSSFIENTDEARMALVADVFTNAETGEVLEIAVGKPKRLYVALNDINGKRIAIGYTFDYYEFVTNGARLNNTEWKNIVYGPKNKWGGLALEEAPDLSEYKPSWLKLNSNNIEE